MQKPLICSLYSTFVNLVAAPLEGTRGTPGCRVTQFEKPCLKVLLRETSTLQTKEGLFRFISLN